MLYVNPLAGVNTLSDPGDPGRRKVALQELEHLFTFTLLQEMRKSVPPDPLFGKDAQRGMFDEMLDDALSGEMARSGQLGLARQVEEQLRIADLQRSLHDQAAGAAGRRSSVPAGLPINGA